MSLKLVSNYKTYCDTNATNVFDNYLRKNKLCFVKIIYYQRVISGTIESIEIK